MPWVKDRDQPGLSEAEAFLIIAAAERAQMSPFSQHGKLWPLLFSVLWHTGRRVGEVLALRPSDLVGLETLRYQPEKTRHSQKETCYCPGPLVYALRRLAISRKGDGLLFPIAPNSVWAAMRRLAKDAGILRHVHPHMFRHGHGRQLARSMQQRGIPAPIIEGAIKRALGHQGFGHTKEYLEPSGAETAEHQREAFGH